MTVAALALAGVGVLYIGYTIGMLYGAVTAARELKRKDETVRLYETMIAQMTTMTAAFMEKASEAINGRKES